MFGKSLAGGYTSGNLDEVKMDFHNENLYDHLEMSFSYGFLSGRPLHLKYSPLHVAFRRGHREICEYLISQMVHDVSGGIIHKIPDNKHVEKALESFCERYQEYDENIRKQIKYILVNYGWLSLLNKTDDGYVWDVTSDTRLLAQCLLDIPPISVLLDCNRKNVEVILVTGPRPPNALTLRGYDDMMILL